LKIHGNRLELSTNEKFSLNSIYNGVEMKKSNRDLNWILKKYGEKVVPYEAQIDIDCSEFLIEK
jgi:hypothetical protein